MMSKLESVCLFTINIFLNGGNSAFFWQLKDQEATVLVTHCISGFFKMKLLNQNLTMTFIIFQLNIHSPVDKQLDSKKKQSFVKMWEQCTEITYFALLYADIRCMISTFMCDQIQIFDFSFSACSSSDLRIQLLPYRLQHINQGNQSFADDS